LNCLPNASSLKGYSPGTRGTQRMDVGKRRRALRLAADDRVDVGRSHKIRHEAALLDQQAGGYVADRKSDRRQVRATQFLDEIVVTAASGQRAQVALRSNASKTKPV